MDDVISKLIGYILAAIVFFLVIVGIVTQYQGAIEDQVSQKATDFINDCRETGLVDADNYNSLQKAVTTYGHYNMTLKIEKRKEYAQYVKEGSSATPALQTRTGYETIDTTTYGKVPAGKRADGTVIMQDTFMEQLQDGKNYALSNGDRISIKILEGHGNFATRMENFLMRADTSNTVLVQYGGVVGE